MNPLSIVILHGGVIQETTFIKYLLQVVIYLAAFGGTAGIVYWGLEAISTTHSGVLENRGDRKNDP